MNRTRPADVEVYSITGAGAAHSDDLNARMGKYLVSMAVRTACVVLAVVVDGWMRWVFVVGAVALPYVAVLLANAGRGRRGAGPAPVGPATRRAVPVGPSRGAVRPAAHGAPDDGG